MLTERQNKVLNYVADYQKQRRSSPSYEEIQIYMGLRAKSGIHRIVHGLIERGFLIKTPGHTRSLRVAGMTVDETGEIAAADSLYQSGFRAGFEAALKRVKAVTDERNTNPHDRRTNMITIENESAQAAPDEQAFDKEDFRNVAKLMRGAKNYARLKAILSNNHKVILAALDLASR